MEKSLTVVEQKVVDQAIVKRDRQAVLDLLEMVAEQGGPADVPIDAALSKALWGMAQQTGTISWLDESFLVWRLHQEIEADVLTASGEMVRAKIPRWWTWESMLAQRASVNPRYEWEWFCSERLSMNHNTAGSRKRAWEVFAVIYGWDRQKMTLAGRGKLQQAASYAEKCWKKRGEIDKKLEVLLVGQPHVCLACDAWVDYEVMEPDDCPHCDSEYRELEPASWERVRQYLHEQKEMAKAQEDSEVDISFNFSGEELARETNVTAWLLRPGAERSVPYQFVKIQKIKPSKMTALGMAEGSQLLSDEEYKEAWLKFRQAIVKA